MKLLNQLFLILAITINCVAQSDPVEFNTNSRICLEDMSKLDVYYQSKNVDPSFDSYTETIKIDRTKYSHNAHNYFAQSIYKYLLDGKLEAYNLEKTKKLNKEEIIERYTIMDTVITYDPGTYEEKFLIRESVDLELISCYRIDQQWSIENSKINAQITGIIPILNNFKNNKELLWIPIEQNDMESIINKNSNI